MGAHNTQFLEINHLLFCMIGQSSISSLALNYKVGCYGLEMCKHAAREKWEGQRSNSMPDSILSLCSQSNFWSSALIFSDLWCICGFLVLYITCNTLVFCMLIFNGIQIKTSGHQICLYWFSTPLIISNGLKPPVVLISASQTNS